MVLKQSNRFAKQARSIKTLICSSIGELLKKKILPLFSCPL